FSGKHESIAQFEEIRDRVIIINGVSKGFAMTGWRLGYMAANLEIAKACNKLQGQVTSGTCSIAQMAGIEAMNTDPKETLPMLEKFRERRDLVLSLLKDIPGIQTNEPQGAFYIFANVSAFFGTSDGTTRIENAGDLCMYLLNKVFVAVVPGDAFGDPECIRLSYATSNEVLTEAIKRLETALKDLK
ncbi:MAG: aminotransferase class I/II-fold pyridoxal phosphate-dependent enzyme, partial [Bacteroidales bacterium]